MYKIAILGCENSHANSFLRFGKNIEDIEFVGVYSDDLEAAQKLCDEFGVPVMESYDSLVGKVDGIMVTARHGDNHFKYAKPYIESGIPMFIDKPVTCTNEDAIEFADLLEKHGVKVSGGSSVPLANLVQELKEDVKNQTLGVTFGGFVRAPVNLDNPYGGFHFYAQHLVQTVCEIFGNYPNSVQAFRNGNIINCIIRYDNFDVSGQFTDGNYMYIAQISCEKGIKGGAFELDDVFEKEFYEYYNILKGGEQKHSYKDFIAPVFVINAINRSIESGKEERVERA